MSLHLYLIRHGQTEWSLSGQHTGRTDLPLTPRGEEQARELAPGLKGVGFSHVLTSPLQRARKTGDLAGALSIRVRDPNETKRVIEAILACLDGGPAAETLAGPIAR